jgi:hypothetical protein
VSIDEIKSAINKDNNLPDNIKAVAKADLNRWLAAIGELYLLSPTMEIYSVGLTGYKPLNEYISITNIFRLHTILNIKLYATRYGDKYAIYCNALGFKFMEIVSEELYNQIYKAITDTFEEFDVFHPYH